VAEVAEEPPEPLGSRRPVRDDGGVGADPCSSRRLGERRRIGERVAAGGSRRRREVGVDGEEGGARDVGVLVRAPPRSRIGQLPAAVDDVEAQDPSVPFA